MPMYVPMHNKYFVLVRYWKTQEKLERSCTFLPCVSDLLAPEPFTLQTIFDLFTLEFGSSPTKKDNAINS